MSIIRIIRKYYQDTKTWIINSKNSMENKSFLLNFLFNSYKIIAISTMFFLLLRTFNIFTNDNKSQWNLHRIYDRNGRVLASDVYELYIEKQPNASITQHIPFLQTILNNYQLDQLLGGKPVVISTKLPTQLHGITQYSSRVRKFQPYVTSIAFSDKTKGIKRGLDLLTSKSDIYTTINITLQTMVGKIIDAGTRNTNSDVGFAFIVNMDGEIEAMYTSDAGKRLNKKDYIHPIYSLFEFGSTFKILTIFTGLFWNKIKLTDTFNIGGGVYLGERAMKDEEYIPPISSVLTIVKHSSNIGTVLIAKNKIGHELLFKTFKLLHLLDPIQTDFVTTLQPQIPKNLKPVDIYTMSFGYTLNTNVLNLLTAFLTIFNNGKLVIPHLFQSTKKSKKSTIFSKNSNISTICNDTIRAMREPASRHPLLLSFHCAGKSGTKHRVVNGKYDHNTVNIFYVCAVPNRHGQYKKLLLFGLLNPKTQLAGVALRALIVQIVQQLGPLVY